MTYPWQTVHPARGSFFLPKTIKDWNSLPLEVVEAPTLDAFVSRVSNWTITYSITPTPHLVQLWALPVTGARILTRWLWAHKKYKWKLLPPWLHSPALTTIDKYAFICSVIIALLPHLWTSPNNDSYMCVTGEVPETKPSSQLCPTMPRRGWSESEKTAATVLELTPQWLPVRKEKNTCPDPQLIA